MSSKTKTAATKEEATPELVPKLRFPGFSGSWAYEPLSKVLKEHKLKNADGREVFSVSMEYGIVNQIELLGRSYAAADTSHYTVGRRYDVVYTKSPLKAFPFGIVKQCKFDGEVALSPLYGVFTPPNPHLGLMIEAYFESPNRSKDFLSPLCQKGAKNTLQITNTTFLSGRLPLPTQPTEQQKIAECLSSVDELMAAQARKVDALKTHKKGLMQQLFPREGETQPRLRFPEFRGAEGWAVKPFDELFTVGNGRDYKHLEAGDVPVYGSGGYMLSVNDYLYEGESVCIGRKGTINNPMFLTGRFWTVDTLFYTHSFKECLPKFIFAIFQQIDWLKHNEAGGVPSLSKTNIQKIQTAVPKTAEQQKIAECLSSVDELIAAQARKLDALKTHKQGLMQRLFPSPEEVGA